MNLGLLTAPLADLPFEDMLDTVAGMGLDAIEVHGRITNHCPLDELLRSKAADFLKPIILREPPTEMTWA